MARACGAVSAARGSHDVRHGRTESRAIADHGLREGGLIDRDVCCTYRAWRAKVDGIGG